MIAGITTITTSLKIISIVALLGGGFFIKHQSDEIAILEKDKQELQDRLVSTLMQVENLKKQTSSLIAKDIANQAEISKVKEKAAKDLTRVEEIAAKKAKLYEKLVNKDFGNTQKELVELTK